MTAAPSRLADALSSRYRIERELGQGGMATVYLAHDLKYARNVAIKVLHPELSYALGPERFLREIAITAQFDHPYILPLLDSGVVEPSTDAGRRLLYYVMPFVEGESLHDLLVRQRQLPVEYALQVTREVAEALAYAHARGVIHRDIKPGNILLSGGHARVADFGIARAIDAAGNPRLTETGLAVGTPAYMSPEQSMAEPDVDGRSDVYALGSVMYEMLAGEPPYTGPTGHAILAKRLANPVPSVRTVRDAVPESVDRALTRALAKAPADRFPTATHFVEALGSATLAPAVTKARRSHKPAWVAGIGLLLALTLGVGWLVTRSRRSPITPSASVIAVLPFLPSTADTALARLGRDLVITISANLDGVGGIRTADPRLVLAGSDDLQGQHGTAKAVALGKRLGAGSVVAGDIVREGDGVRLDLKLLSTSGDSQPLARASFASPLDSISALTDSVTWSLLRQIWRRGDPPSVSYANLTTRSMESLRAFLAGEQFTIAGSWPEAIEAYATAIKADSTFWLAGWRYNSAQGWLLEARPDTALARRYEAHLSSFGERDRLLIELDMNGASLTEGEWLARSRAIVDRFPDDWSVWWKYADALHHWGPLLGYTNAEARAALQRTVDLNPRLVPMWDHLFDASIGHDSSQAARAARTLAELGRDRIGRRLLLAAGAQQLPVAVRDSFAGIVLGSTNWMLRAIASNTLYAVGFPAAQIELNRRMVQLSPRDSLVHYVWEGTSNAWAARGAWDSVLAAFDHWAAADHRGAADRGILPLMYEVAVSGAWLGGLDMGRAAARRAPALEYIRSLPPGSPAARKQAARVAWADGILAVLRKDLPGLERARLQLQQEEGAAQFRERVLAGLELELRGAKKAAAESLAALDLSAPDSLIGTPHDPYARSISHLAASRLMLEQGDTTRALKLLAWHQASIPASPESGRFQIFSALAYYELARIEEAQGRTQLAREHYQQFLRRYDLPAPEHQYLVDGAKAALERQFSDDGPRRPD